MTLSAPAERGLAELIAIAQRDGRLPSIVAAIAQQGQLVWAGSAGDVAGPAADTQYRIGSITKTFTAVLVMQAVRDGLMRLEAPLADYVPEAPFGSALLQDLLSHSAGIAAEPAGPWWERAQGGSFEQLAKANCEAPSLAEPGEMLLYSNLAYALLGEAVARTRGSSWEDLVSTRILQPLGMTRTTVHPAEPHAQGYSVDHFRGTLTPEPASDTAAMGPAGQLWSTLTDLATYSEFVMRGHPEVLEMHWLALMSTPHAPGGSYGLGFHLLPTASGLLVGHTGTMPGFMAKLQTNRSTATAAIVLANGTVGLDPNGLTERMLATAGLREPAQVQAWAPSVDVPEHAEAMVGAWYWGERLHLALWSMGELELRSVTPDDEVETFTYVDGRWVDSLEMPLQVSYRADGSVEWFCFDTYLFTRSPYEPGTPIPR